MNVDHKSDHKKCAKLNFNKKAYQIWYARPNQYHYILIIGGECRDRTGDLLLARQAL